MSKQEWMMISRKLVAWWPHNNVPIEALQEWYEELADLEANHVAIAAKAICADGTPHMPNWAAIRGRVLDLMIDAPDFSQVVKEVGRIARRMPDRYTPTDQRDRVKQQAQEGLHPLICSWIDAVGWKHIRHANLEDRVAYAQLRDTWTAHVKRQRRDIQLGEITAQISPTLKPISYLGVQSDT